MSGFIGKCKTQKCRTKLIAPPYFLAVARIILSETFHIMNIETHHMTNAMRHKKRMCACCNCLINFSFH